MQCAGEMGEESLGTTVSTESLRCHFRGHRAYVEDISLAAGTHILTEEVTEHRRSVHMQIHDERSELFAVIEDVAVMINTGIVDQYLHLYIVRVRVII